MSLRNTLLNKGRKFDLLCTSPLMRAMETAKELNIETILQGRVLVVPDLSEQVDTWSDIGTPRVELEQKFNDFDFSTAGDRQYLWPPSKLTKSFIGREFQRETKESVSL